MSDFLFSNPTTIDGIMSVIDLFGIAPEYNTSKTPEKADQRAFNEDITALIGDFNNAYIETKGIYAEKDN